MNIELSRTAPKYVIKLKVTELEAEALKRFHGKFSHNAIQTHMKGCNTSLRDAMCNISSLIYRSIEDSMEG